MTAFVTIMADPPWQYRDGLTMSAVKRGAASNYRTMSVEAICDLYTPSRVNGRGTYSTATLAGHPVAKDAHLYLWTTNAFMEQAHQVAVAWGFLPRTILTWIKPRIGMGHYYRNTTEHIVFAVRGKLPTRRKDQPTHFEAPVGRHSEKPEQAYEIVERMSPGPYLELFARRPRANWTVWGNEVTGNGRRAHDEREPPLPLPEDIPESWKPFTTWPEPPIEWPE